MNNQSLQDISEELTRHLSARYINNGNTINMLDIIDVSKHYIAVNLLIIKKRLGFYNDDLFENIIKGVSVFLKDKFREFNDQYLELIRVETLLLLEEDNVKDQINLHYDNLYGADGGKVI